jgi:hypothetical protein
MVSLPVQELVPEFLRMSSILACTQLILNLQAVFQVAIRPLAMVAVLQIVMVTELMLREQLLVQITDSL